ncbi:MAG: ATP-binding cassette domain-containing protein [Spirochaetales bacterium]|nr:ATP-binding cassette domain-containing protein [Spirochaetales bacterium]
MIFKNYTTEINNKKIYIPNWEINNGENWAVLGNNGSGKTLLGQILEKYDCSTVTGYVSFEKAENLLEEERLKDDTDFIDMEDPGTLVSTYLTNHNTIFNINEIKDRGLRYLSTGELVKVIILKELEKKPKYLILDEPYDGLDIESQLILETLISQLCDSEITLILILNRERDIHNKISHVAFIHENRVTLTGLKDEILSSESFSKIRHFSGIIPQQLPGVKKINSNVNSLICFINVSIAFGDKKVLHNINWNVERKEHYKITGPNGSGKSTLLKIVSADNHQAYGQDISLFGMKRGSGESIWDIKKYVGLVSSSLQNDYRVSNSVLSVIISGFYDSIGLYNKPSEIEINIAKDWIKLVGLEDRENSPFKELSFGEQRIILIIRAMVKHPDVLIVDEPCLGLDQVNREFVLLLLDYIGKNGETTLLYVSHRVEDYIPSIKKELHLIPTENGSIGQIKETV